MAVRAKQKDRVPGPGTNKIAIVPGSAWGNNPKFTIAEAAVALGLPLRTTYDHVKFGRLGHVRLGSQLYVRQSHIDKFIADGNKEAL